MTAPRGMWVDVLAACWSDENDAVVTEAVRLAEATFTGSLDELRATARANLGLPGPRSEPEGPGVSEPQAATPTRVVALGTGPAPDPRSKVREAGPHGWGHPCGARKRLATRTTILRRAEEPMAAHRALTDPARSVEERFTVALDSCYFSMGQTGDRDHFHGCVALAIADRLAWGGPLTDTHIEALHGALDEALKVVQVNQDACGYAWAQAMCLFEVCAEHNPAIDPDALEALRDTLGWTLRQRRGSYTALDLFGDDVPCCAAWVYREEGRIGPEHDVFPVNFTKRGDGVPLPFGVYKGRWPRVTALGRHTRQ